MRAWYDILGTGFVFEDFQGGHGESADGRRKSGIDAIYPKPPPRLFREGSPKSVTSVRTRHRHATEFTNMSGWTPHFRLKAKSVCTDIPTE
jgi:hypothetical protein